MQGIKNNHKRQTEKIEIVTEQNKKNKNVKIEERKCIKMELACCLELELDVDIHATRRQRRSVCIAVAS